MPLGIGMETVAPRVVEIAGMGIRIGIKPADAVQVDDGDGPDVRSLLDRIHIGIRIEAEAVGIGFVGLDVVVPETGVSPVDGGQQDHLLVREIRLQVGHRDIDTAAESIPVHRQRPPCPDLRPGAGHLDRYLTGRIPLTQGRPGIEIVRPGKDQDRIDVAAALGPKFLALPRHVPPLLAVDPVDERHEAEHLLQILPIVLRRADMRLVGDRIAHESDFPSLPLGTRNRQQMIPVPGIGRAHGGTEAQQPYRAQTYRISHTSNHL